MAVTLGGERGRGNGATGSSRTDDPRARDLAWEAGVLGRRVTVGWNWKVLPIYE